LFFDVLTALRPTLAQFAQPDRPHSRADKIQPYSVVIGTPIGFSNAGANQKAPSRQTRFRLILQGLYER